MGHNLLRVTAISASLLLGACQHNPFHNADYIVGKGWANEGEAGPNISPTYTPTAENLYCYKSLAQVDCYTSPQPGKEHLRVGQSAPAVIKETPVGGQSACQEAPSDKVDVHALPIVIHKDPHDRA